MLNKILVPIDFSITSDAALEHAVELSRRCHAQLVLVHADEFPALAPGEPAYVPSDVLDEHAHALRARLSALRERTLAQGVSVRASVVVGPAYHVILEAAERELPDMIVMGTHGRRGFRRFALGSVTERIVRAARCPVLTVRPPKRAQAEADAPNAGPVGAA